MRTGIGSQPLTARALGLGPAGHDGLEPAPYGHAAPCVLLSFGAFQDNDTLWNYWASNYDYFVTGYTFWMKGVGGIDPQYAEQRLSSGLHTNVAQAVLVADATISENVTLTPAGAYAGGGSFTDIIGGGRSRTARAISVPGPRPPAATAPPARCLPEATSFFSTVIASGRSGP